MTTIIVMFFLKVIPCEDPKFEKIKKNGVGFVPEWASLLDAKNRMESLEGCSDVFITKTGQKDEPVLGWITNVIIFRKGG